MNNADVIVGWTGLALALVLGYGAFKNKPVFGANGVITTAIQTGKISSGNSSGGTSVPPSTGIPNNVPKKAITQSVGTYVGSVFGGTTTV